MDDSPLVDDKIVNRVYSAPTKLRGVTEKSQTPFDAAAKSRYLSPNKD